jgi:hypothetical protein
MSDARRPENADHSRFDAWLAARAADGTLHQLLSGPAPEQTIVLGEDSKFLWRDLPARLSSAMVRESRDHISFPDFLKPRQITIRLVSVLPGLNSWPSYRASWSRAARTGANCVPLWQSEPCPIDTDLLFSLHPTHLELTQPRMQVVATFTVMDRELELLQGEHPPIQLVVQIRLR